MQSNKRRKRTLSAILALTLLGTMDFRPFLPAGAVTEDEQMNAAKALGLKDDAPDDFDENDVLKNPYGRKTVKFGDAKEVVIGYSEYKKDEDGEFRTHQGFWMFGEDSQPGQKVTLDPKQAVATDTYVSDSMSLSLSGIHKTLPGNFDGNTEGKVNQYLMLKSGGSISDSSITLSVHDGKTQNSQGEIEFAIANDIFENNDELTGIRDKISSGYISAQMSAAVGDFDGNGIDEIAVLTNSRTGVQTEYCDGSMADYPDEPGHYDDPTGMYPDGYDLYLVREEHEEESGEDDGTDPVIGKVIVSQWNDEYIDKLLAENENMTREQFFEEFGKHPKYIVAAVALGMPIATEIRYYEMMKNEQGEIQEVGMRIFATDNFIGSCINVYAYTNPEADFLDIKQWELKRTYAVNACESVSLAAGDVNGDGIDDLVVGECKTVGYENENPSSLKVYSGAYKNMLTESTVVDSAFSKYGVTVFTDNSAGKPQTYIGMLANDGKDEEHGKDGKDAMIAVYQFDGEKYQMVGSVPVRLTVEQNLFENELYFANDYLCTPLSESCAHFSANRLTKADYGEYDMSDAITTDDSIAFDFQPADLNGNRQETVLFQKMSYGSYSSGSIKAHSFGSSDDIRFSDRREDSMYAIINIDDDTSYMTYTGKHWFDYTEPKVLAVLASPPYFKDLLEQDDLSGNYAESTTAYGSSKGSGSGSSETNSFSVGAYVSYEQDFNVFGATVASFEAELSTDVSFTDEYEESVELTYSLEYATSSGADAVVFYSVPFEFYEYDVDYICKSDKENEPPVHKTMTRTLCIPKTPSVATVELEKYRSIAANYSELPDLSNVLKHELGVPDSYPKSTKGYKNVREFDGNYLAVDFTSAGGGITQTQSIEMTKDTCYSSNIGVDTELKAGAGAGGFVVGISLGYGYEAGTMTTTTEGSSFTATVQNMPKEAEEYGYGMSWKLFSHEGSYVNSAGNTVSFPVVDYLVTDVTQPPSLVTDLRQDYKNSSDTSIMLEWNYDNTGDAEFFNVFRLSDINGKVVKALVATVPASKGSLSYTLLDDGENASGSRILMKPGMQYEYQVVAARDPSKPPCVSMPSEVLYAYTHADGVYPDITLTGITNNKLTVYPDREYTIGTEIGNEDDFLYIVYQWQKRGKTGWTDLPGAASAQLKISDPDPDTAGKYRCRVDALAYNTEMNSQVGVTVFTDDIDVSFQMRSVKQEAFAVSCSENQPEAVLTLSPSSAACLVPPTGTVEFTVQGGGFEETYSVPLKADRRMTTAKLSDAENLGNLANGIYQISASYSGDSIYGSFQTKTVSVLVGDDVILPVLFNQDGKRTDSFCYGDSMTVKFYSYKKKKDGTTAEKLLSDMTKQFGITGAELKDLPGVYDKTIKTDDAEYTYSYTLKKRPVEIGISDAGALYAGDVEGRLPQAVLLTDLVEGDTIDELVTIVYKNGLGTKEISIDNRTVPGTYYAKLMPVTTEPNKTAYYDLKLYSATFSIFSKIYDLNFISELVEDNEAGAVRMTLPEKKTLTNETVKYESGTPVKLTAAPYSGYLFDHWTVNEETYTTETIKFNMPSQAFDVHVYFKKDDTAVKHGSIMVDETFLQDGTLEYPADFDNEKVYPLGKEFTFKAVDSENSAFAYWNQVVGRKTYTVFTKEIAVTVSEIPVILYPVFTGAPCTVTLGNGITASYEALDDQDETYTMNVLSGDSVPKGTVLTLNAPADDQTDDSAWYVNGAQQSDNQKTWTLQVTEDVTIEWKSASEIPPEFCKLTLTNENGVMPTASIEDLSAIPYGTEITLTAPDADGCIFTGWYEGETLCATDAEYTFTVTKDAELTAKYELVPAVRLPGDANGDGEVDLVDVILIRRYLVGGWNITINLSNADVDGDGDVTQADVVLIRRYLAGGWNVRLK